MANTPLAYPNLLTDPGYLYWAPLGTALPANTVAGGVFTDQWSAVPAWIPMGMTEGGTDIDITYTVAPILAAELIEPLAYRTTDRTGTITFQTKNITASWMARAFNGAATTVTGTAGTTLTQVDPPVLGTEVRAMIGFESVDNTYRFFGFQTFNSGSIKRSYHKGVANVFIPWTLMLEKPQSSGSFREFFAGTGRA